MSSLFSTFFILPSHLTLEMQVALCIGMEMMVVAFGAPIDSLDSELVRTLAGEFTSEGIQHNRNGRPYYLTCSKVGDLRLGWSIINRKHNFKRSIRSGFNPTLT